MTVNDISKHLECTVHSCGYLLSSEIRTACGSDMMSDVLAYVKDQAVLLTGLMNPQVVRTAEMMDIACVVFVRGKTPDSNITELAEEKGIVVLSTKYRMFEACGILYQNGLSRSEAEWA